MAKGARGLKSYIPSVQGVVKILIVLMVLKLVVNATYGSLPAGIQPYVPTL
jgi:hypothetical protein